MKFNFIRFFPTTTNNRIIENYYELNKKFRVVPRLKGLARCLLNGYPNPACLAAQSDHITHNFQNALRGKIAGI